MILIKNVRITSTQLGNLRGGLSAYIYFADEAQSFTFGGRLLSNGNACSDFVGGICNVIQVEHWELLEDALCRIQVKKINLGEVLVVGHIIENRWFSMHDFVNHHAEDKPAPTYSDTIRDL